MYALITTTLFLQVRTKHNPTKWPVPDTVPQPSAIPGAATFNVHPLGPPVMPDIIPPPAAAPLPTIPPPPMPKSFRVFNPSSHVFFPTGLTDEISENRRKNTSENLNPDVPEFIPIVNGHEEPKKNGPKECVDECAEAMEEKLLVSDTPKGNVNGSDNSGMYLRDI